MNRWSGARTTKIGITRRGRDEVQIMKGTSTKERKERFFEIQFNDKTQENDRGGRTGLHREMKKKWQYLATVAEG